MNVVNKSILFKISTRLGFKGVKSYSNIYKGGSINTFGNKNNSVSFFTIHLNKNEDSVLRIETNTTYFKPTEQINKINSLVSFENPMALNDVLTYLTKKL